MLFHSDSLFNSNFYIYLVLLCAKQCDGAVVSVPARIPVVGFFNAYLES